MRAMYMIDGFVNDTANDKLFQKEKLQVNVTKDRLGCTLSIASNKKGLQYSIPFDGILKELMKNER